MSDFPLESLLSAKQVLSPQLVGDSIYFISDISGAYSLYAMNREGSYPEALLPAGTALQNPHLMGRQFQVFPDLGKILVMMDRHGDENYQPMFIPLEGGIPKPLFGDTYVGQQLRFSNVDEKANIAYFSIDDRKNPGYKTIQVQLEPETSPVVKSLGWGKYGNFPAAYSKNHDKVLLFEGYMMGDNVIYIGTPGVDKRKLLLGTPIEKREKGKEIQKYNVVPIHFTDHGVLSYTTKYDEMGGLALLIEHTTELIEVKITGVQHKGIGELDSVEHLEDDVFCLEYNIDGVSWLYEGRLDADKAEFEIHRTIIGQGSLANGVEVGWKAQKTSQGFEYVVSFTTAAQPVQLYYISPGNSIRQLTKERVLGIPEGLLSEGESCNYISFDGLEISNRLYLPSPKLDIKPPYPLVLYIHGGPQSQERPDFTWFSMPLIQYLTLNGFAVTVPNVRGSTGYGLSYSKHVDHDWGGKDMQDHIELLKHLKNDSRIDSSRRAVVGRSYGGYMTLSLVSRHPDLWGAACDMFGPYNLFTFIERLPPSWREYFYIAVGHPERDQEFLKERSPSTYFDQVKAPLLILQGRNDPRVIAAESEDIVNHLKEQGKLVEILIFEDEGHDVIKFKNKLICYQKIVDFFKEHLK
ncbi:MAG: S9 family peptidase [Candidatus Hermodarchaeota archaeon]